jgi:hypothetical protein
VLGFSSGDGGTTWRIGWPNLPSIPGISVTGGNPTIDYTVIQQPVAVTAPITLTNGKTIGRDVILGIFLFFILFQLLPESTTMLITAIISFVSVNKDTIIAELPPPVSDDMEVRVGIPKF